MSFVLHPDAKPAVVVDIDGTVADLRHRLRYIKGPAKDWDSFYSPSAIYRDRPIAEIIAVVHALVAQGAYHLVMASGRPERTREATEEWLARHYISPEALYMRRDDDRRPDELVKQEIMWTMLFDGYVPSLVIDDRARVVAMWRRHGIKVIAVAEGRY